MPETSRIISTVFDPKFLEDSSSDEEDELIKTYAGRSVFDPVPGEKTQAKIVKSTPLTPSQESEPEAKPTISKEEIERKAQKVVDDASLHVVQRVTSMEDIGWRRTTKALHFKVHAPKKGTHTYYYPCIRHEDSDLLFGGGGSRTSSLSKKRPSIGIQYFGWDWGMSASVENIVESTFCPWTESNDQVHEERLQAFLEAVFGAADGDYALERRTEELIIRAHWAKVRRQQQQAQEDARATDAEAFSTVELRKGIQRREPTAAVKPTNTTKDSESSEEDEDRTDSDSNDDHDTPVKQKRVALRPGDVIQFYDPIGVAGKKEWLRTTEIIGIDPNNKAFPLNLKDGAHLSPDHRIKRVAKLHRGKRLQDSEGRFREIRNYSLRTSGTKDLVAFQERVNRVKASRKAHAASMDQFWEERADGVSEALESTISTTDTRGSSQVRPLGANNCQDQPQPTPKPTNRRKRQKQELADSLSSLPNDALPRLSQHFETMKPSDAGQKRRRSVSSVSADVQQSVSSSSRGSICNMSASARKRRRSDVSTASTRSSVPMDETRMRLSTHGHYEPPSVLRRRKRRSSQVGIDDTNHDSSNKPVAESNDKTNQKGGRAKRDQIDAFRQDLQDSIDEVKTRMLTSRRYKPHMTVDQLELGLQAWEHLAVKKDPATKWEAALTSLADEIEISHHKLTRYLLGDHRKLLNSAALQDVFGKLQEWIG